MVSEFLTSIFDNTILFVIPAVLFGMVLAVSGYIGKEILRVEEMHFWQRQMGRVFAFGVLLLFVGVCLYPIKWWALPQLLEAARTVGL